MHSVAARYQSISTSVRPPSRSAPVSAYVTFQSWRKMKRMTPRNTVRAATSPAYARWERAVARPIHAYLAAALIDGPRSDRPCRLRLPPGAPDPRSQALRPDRRYARSPPPAEDPRWRCRRRDLPRALPPPRARWV